MNTPESLFLSLGEQGYQNPKSTLSCLSVKVRMPCQCVVLSMLNVIIINIGWIQNNYVSVGASIPYPWKAVTERGQSLLSVICRWKVSTSQALAKRGPTVVIFPAGVGGLKEKSYALCHQVTLKRHGYCRVSRMPDQNHQGSHPLHQANLP